MAVEREGEGMEKGRRAFLKERNFNMENASSCDSLGTMEQEN